MASLPGLVLDRLANSPEAKFGRFGKGVVWYWPFIAAAFAHHPSTASAGVTCCDSDGDFTLGTPCFCSGSSARPGPLDWPASCDLWSPVKLRITDVTPFCTRPLDDIAGEPVLADSPGMGAPDRCSVTRRMM